MSRISMLIDRDVPESFNDFMQRSQALEWDFNLEIADWWHKNFGFQYKSRIGSQIDLYHDLILTHVPHDLEALVWYEDSLRRALTYAQLDEEVEILARIGRANGLKPGKTVAIVAARIHRRLIAILAAIRLGLVPSIIEPKGPAYIANQLTILNCDYIYSESAFLGGIPEQMMPRLLDYALEGKVHPPGEHTEGYRSSDTALRILDAPGMGVETVFSVAACDLYRGLIRDGYFIFGMRRGSRALSLASFEGMPYFALAAFLMGASVTIIRKDGLQHQAEKLLANDYDLIGFDHEAMGLLHDKVKTIPRSGNWARWFRDARSTMNPAPWLEFSERLGLQEIPRCDVLWQTPSVGLAFAGTWTTDRFEQALYPVPGMSWALGDMSAPLNPSSSAYGRFCAIESIEEEPVHIPTPVMLVALGSGYRCLGRYPVDSNTKGYPADLVQKLLDRQGGWHLLLEKPMVNSTNPSRMVLLSFMDARSESSLRKLIQEELGGDAVPDEIEMIDLMPCFDDDSELDHQKCGDYYFKGEWHRRQALPLYRSIAKLMLTLATDSTPSPLTMKS